MRDVERRLSNLEELVRQSALQADACKPKPVDPNAAERWAGLLSSIEPQRPIEPLTLDDLHGLCARCFEEDPAAEAEYARLFPREDHA